MSDADPVRPSHWRSPIPRGESYPVQLGQVCDRLTVNGGQVREVAFVLRPLTDGHHRPYSLLDGGQWDLATAQLIAEGSRVVYSGSINVRILSVPSAERHLVSNLLIDDGLLDCLAEWVRDAEHAPQTWRAMWRRCTISLTPELTAVPVCERLHDEWRLGGGEPDSWPPRVST